ncbi:response regulator [Magnetococcus sp. PR-3]|uniref:response regulator n=1 Tax=Magnetococcus sp. PR-3 TaxID=3120355 RepID=UPI002FCE0CCE
MNNEVTILIAEDDSGHAGLIRKNLKRAGISNNLHHFKDGQEVIDFLFCLGEGPHREKGEAYMLLLDIRMPRMDGVEVLKRIKEDRALRKLPVMMLTTTDDPREIEKCYDLGCSNYITKPIDYDKFVEAIRSLGLFLSVVQIPHVNGLD